MTIFLLSIIALFGLYSIFVAILLMATGRYSNNGKGAVVALLTAIAEIGISVSAIYVYINAILSDITLWFAVGVLLGLNILVFVLWGKVKY
ncbi:MAG TPA: hypothetical protein PKC65_11050 [Pyrinomonadaceae bacterium]|nr:hypothetical protein [Pyrinomonadaceae bacterium]